MNNKRIVMIIAIICFVLGVGTCFAVAIMTFKEDEKDLEVRIERAGVCNPMKPVEEKTLPISEEIEDKIQDYWKKTDKDKAPGVDEVCDCIIGDYKIFVGEDEILFNLDLGYVSFNGEEVDISDGFHKYLNKVITENDKELES